MEKARFADAQINDLVWNDDLGLCRITRTDHQGNFPIAVERTGKDGLIDCPHSFTLEGKRLMDSPKATLYYYSEEDHYLAERLKTENPIPCISEGYCPCGQYLGKAFSFLSTLPCYNDGRAGFLSVPCPNDKCDRTYTVWVKK